MTEWLKKLQDQRVNEGANEDIERQKYEIAVRSTPQLANLLMDQIKADVAVFKKTFRGERIDLIIPDPLGLHDLRVRTRRFPLLTVCYRFGAAQLEYLKQYMETHGAPMAEKYGIVLVRADFNQSCWYQHGEETIMTTEDLSRMLLAELFEEASK